MLDAGLKVVEKPTSLKMLRHQRHRVQQVQCQAFFDGSEVGREDCARGLVVGQAKVSRGYMEGRNIGFECIWVNTCIVDI